MAERCSSHDHILYLYHFDISPFFFSFFLFFNHWDMFFYWEVFCAALNAALPKRFLLAILSHLNTIYDKQSWQLESYVHEKLAELSKDQVIPVIRP